MACAIDAMLVFGLAPAPAQAQSAGAPFGGLAGGVLGGVIAGSIAAPAARERPVVVYVSERGHILTNNHVVEGCSEYLVRQPGRGVVKARDVASDATNDLAVLTTDAPQAAVPPLSVRARLGENVSVSGYPQSDVLASTGNFTIGNVTATAGSGDDTRKIQISAPVHQGNSGGPAPDQYGTVIGVIQSKQIAFASGDVPQNVNFAIKSMIALNFLEANGVEPPITVRTTNPMDGTAIAGRARDFTVQIACH